jgi:spermidine synthase
MYKTSSVYNRDIRVQYIQGKPLLLVNRIHESGRDITDMLDDALVYFGLKDIAANIRSALVLGVAGGSVINSLLEVHHQAKVTGVDIDPRMLEVGKKYFGLSKLPAVHLIAADARTYVSKKTKDRYDLVFIDLYIGRNIPDFLLDTKFLQDVKAILHPKGKLVINYLCDGDYKKKSGKLHAKLVKLFGRAEEWNIYNNRFFYASLR